MGEKRGPNIQIEIAKLHELYRYDPGTGHILLRNAVPNRALPAGARVGSVEKSGYVRIMVGKRKVLAHRAAWAMTHGYWPPQLIDHINMDKADNRLSNLRLATVAQNAAHSRPVSLSGRRGVVRVHKCKTWRAHVKQDGKYKHLGTFDSIDEAAHAYNKAAIALYGDFAVLNPIGEDKNPAAPTTKEG